MTGIVKRPVIIWALLLVIVLVNGFMAPPSVSHAEPYACHQTESHSTGLCAWLCVGSVGIGSSDIPFSLELQLLEWISTPSNDVVLSVVPLPYLFRGPPRLIAQPHS